MNNDSEFELELEELFSIRVEEPITNKKDTIKSWFQRIITLDGMPNQKHHRPIFIIIMSILHIIIHLLIYIKTSWKGQSFAFTLFDLCKFYVPCMRPARSDIRYRIVDCPLTMKNGTCHYDDVLKHICFSFTYPYQLWRMLSVNLLHMDWLHLLSNLLAQLVQGIPLERKYGSVRVTIIYWLSDVGASLSFMIKHMEESGVGSSGAMYGLMLFLIVDRLIAMQANTGRRLFIILQLTLLLLPYFAASIPLMIKYNVAHSAHVGGGLVGFLFGIGMFGCPWPWHNQGCISQKTCRRISLVFLFLYYVLAFTIFFTKDVPVVNSILHNS